MRIKVLRQLSPATSPYWEEFSYDGERNISVAALLDFLNYNDDIVDINGKKTTRIGWECSCLQGICGGCAMVVNNTPCLACETFLKNIRGDRIVIRPLQKFPVIHDLVVDRSVIHQNLTQSNVFIGEYQPSSKGDQAHQYAAAKCLKCGLCLEVCPNYTGGESFFGALFANDCYLVSARNGAKRKEIKKAYEKHFANGCSKSLSCMDVCPAGIQTLASIAKMNR